MQKSIISEIGEMPDIANITHTHTHTNDAALLRERAN